MENGESIENGAKRELKEEVGLEAISMSEVGILNFEFENDPDILEVHIFEIKDFRGEPEETDEMKPRWFTESDIPYEKMWSDDSYWLPILLSGKNFTGRFLFDKPSNTEYQSVILEKELKIL